MTEKVKKVTETDTCWLCSHFEYVNAREYCNKSRKFFNDQFRDDGEPIPKWCRLPDAS